MISHYVSNKSCALINVNEVKHVIYFGTEGIAILNNLQQVLTLQMI
jgi:hypothetical protein